jgi:hypothetical protein
MEEGVVRGYDKAKADLLFTQKLCLCLHLLGAESDLISTVSSWRETMDDEMVLFALDEWLNHKIKEQERNIAHVTRWHKKS